VPSGLIQLHVDSPRPSRTYVIGSRIPIDTVVRPFLKSDSPETIRGSFPTLTLEQVYGAIAFLPGPP
jgi:hypothetical protein